MQRDTAIFDLIYKEMLRQRNGIELIASENFTSLQVMQAMGNVMTNKYAEGYPGKRYYGGCEIVDEAENLAIERLKQIFNIEYANVQPHSGAQANGAVFLACMKPGEKVLQLRTNFLHEAGKYIIGKIVDDEKYGYNQQGKYGKTNNLSNLPFFLPGSVGPAQHRRKAGDK